jgi:hypothetical protein
MYLMFSLLWSGLIIRKQDCKLACSNSKWEQQYH